MDCYRDTDDTGPCPYRARVGGLLLRNQDGSTKRFRSLREAVTAARAAMDRR